jgi:hypothetical protein
MTWLGLLHDKWGDVMGLAVIAILGWILRPALTASAMRFWGKR